MQAAARFRAMKAVGAVVAQFSRPRHNRAAPHAD